MSDTSKKTNIKNWLHAFVCIFVAGCFCVLSFFFLSSFADLSAQQEDSAFLQQVNEVLAKHRGEYSSWEGARAVLEKEGYADFSIKQNDPYLYFTGNSLITHAKFRAETKGSELDDSQSVLNPYSGRIEYKVSRRTTTYVSTYTLVTTSLDLRSLNNQLGADRVLLDYHEAEQPFVEDYMTQSVFYDGSFFSYRKRGYGAFDREEVSDPFSFRHFDRRLVVTDRVDSVPEGVFAGLSVSSVQIASLQSVPKGAFRNCVYLERVEFPAALRSVEEEAFAGCQSLFELSFAEGLTSVADGAFAGCQALNRLFLPKSLTSLSPTAFDGADRITCINYAGSREDYHAVSAAIPAFAGRILRYEGNDYTGGYSSLVLDEESKTFVSRCYLGQAQNTTVQAVYRKGESEYLSAGVSPYAYAYDTFLRSLFLAEGIPAIGDFAFYHTALSTVTLCDSVSFVGVGAFSDCYRLEFISVSKGNGRFVSLNGVLFSLQEGEATLLAYPSARNAIRYEVPTSVEKNGTVYPVTKIEAHAFENPLYTQVVSVAEGIAWEKDSMIGVEVRG